MWPEGLLMPSKEALWRFVTFDWLFSLYSDSVLPLIMIISVCFVFLFAFVLYMISSLIRPKPLKLDRAHVLVTGGSREIGKSIAIECIKQGALVTLVVYSDEDKLEQVKEDVEKYAINDNQEVLCFAVEVVNNYNKVESVVRLAQEKLGPVDMLVNCAGMSMSGTFEELSVHHFLKLIDVNYLDSVYATHIVIGGMKERKKGRVVFLCSQAGQLGLIGHTAYSASKFALRGLAEALQMEVKPYNVYVTVAYLPDLHMPSLAEDNKPFETKQISELSEVYQPECVAKVIVKDAVHGNFSSSIGPDGYMLSVLTCGMSPITSITEGLLQILIMGLFRSVALIYLSISDRIIHRKMIQKEQSKISDKSE